MSIDFNPNTYPDQLKEVLRKTMLRMPVSMFRDQVLPIIQSDEPDWERYRVLMGNRYNAPLLVHSDGNPNDIVLEVPPILPGMSSKVLSNDNISYILDDAKKQLANRPENYERTISNLNVSNMGIDVNREWLLGWKKVLEYFDLRATSDADTAEVSDSKKIQDDASDYF